MIPKLEDVFNKADASLALLLQRSSRIEIKLFIDWVGVIETPNQVVWTRKQNPYLFNRRKSECGHTDSCSL